MIELGPETVGEVELSSGLDRDALLERAQKIRNLLADPKKARIWRIYTRLLVEYTEAYDAFVEVDRQGKLLVAGEARNQARQLQAASEALGKAFKAHRDFRDDNNELIQAIKGLRVELQLIEQKLQNQDMSPQT